MNANEDAVHLAVCEERVEHRDGMGDCFCCEVCVVREDGVVLEEHGICEPLAVAHVDEAYCARMVRRAVRELREQWKDSLRPCVDFDLAAVCEGL